MSTTASASTIPRPTDAEIDEHVAAIFDAPVAANHKIRLTCTCGRAVILFLSGAGEDTEQAWVCPLCAPSFDDDLRA